jgi:hypothetical protein
MNKFSLAKQQVFLSFENCLGKVMKNRCLVGILKTPLDIYFAAIMNRRIIFEQFVEFLFL